MIRWIRIHLRFWINKYRLRFIATIYLSAIGICAIVLSKVGYNRYIEFVITLFSLIAIVDIIMQISLSVVDRSDDRREHRIVYISNDSAFSIRLWDGIEERHSNYLSERIDYSRTREWGRADLDDSERILNIVSNTAFKSEGIILRYKKIDREFADRLLHIREHQNSKIILLDTCVMRKTEGGYFQDLEANNNFCIVNSDVERGAHEIIEQIKLIKVFNKKIHIIFVKGPMTDPMISIRCHIIDSFVKGAELSSTIVDIVEVNKLVASGVFPQMETLIASQQGELNDVDAVVCFCGNDQIAYELMINLKLNKSRFPKLHEYLKAKINSLYVFGYDGLLDTDKEKVHGMYPFKLEAFSEDCNYYSINTKPEMQGEMAMDKTIDAMEYEKNSVGFHSVTGEVFCSRNWREKITNYKLLVFDLDGTIADTEPYHLEAYNQVLGEYNINIKEVEFAKYMGKREDEIHLAIQEKRGVKYNIEAKTNERLECYLNIVHEKQLKPYPIILSILKGVDVPKVIVSSQKRWIIDQLLEEWEITEFFKDVISCPEIGKDKRFVYQNCTDILQAKASEIALFEDSENALKIAEHVGFFKIAIDNGMNSKELLTYDQVIFVKDDNK